MDSTPSVFRFGAARLDVAQRQLRIDGQPAKLGARAFDVLLALLERRDRTVNKNELFDLVWPGVVVEENNLQVHISALRKLLGPQTITTIPGRGYRFTLDVQTTGAVPPVGEGGDAIAAEGAGQPTPQPDQQTNLPRHLPPLYGRATELARVHALLAEHVVVTIAGAGGMGKTRLALAVAHQIAHQAQSDFADGVWLVEMAALSSGELVAAEVARVLRLPQSADGPAVEAMVAALQAQSLLLVLDNCEHVLPAVATLVDKITQAAPAVRILVTSQEPLKTTEEHVFRLDTLAVPAMAGADAAQHGAVQLFVERAQAADPRFALTPANAPAVVEICRRLDGIPLALELAAARVALLGIEGLRARLDERLQVLTGGSRFVLRRHQTLRAAMDFSHGLLSVEERVVFRRLGVFAGSFALETAPEVATDDANDSWAVLDHLGALVDKSMVVAEGDQLPRLRLLETTRAYALEKLADAEESASMLERHARAMASLFSRMYDEFWHLSDDKAVWRYEPDLDNLRAALAWSMRNDAELAIALVGDSRPLWLELGLQPEARLYCEAAVSRISAATPPRAAGRLWQALAAMLSNTHPAQSRDASVRAIELLRDADDPGTLAAALMIVAFWSNAPPAQQQLEALDQLSRMNDPQWPARMRLFLPNASARMHRSAGRFAEARRNYELARDLAARAGAIQWELASQTNVAEIALIMGDLDFAISTYREMVRRMTSRRDKLFYMFALGGLATALLFKSETAAAREALTAARPLIVRYDLGATYATTAALLAAQEERMPAAAQLLGYSNAAFVEHGLDADDPAGLRARALTMQRLAATLPQNDIEERMREGSTLGSEEAYRLALGIPTA